MLRSAAVSLFSPSPACLVAPLAAAARIGLAALLLAQPSFAVTVDWVTVGDPGNACDTQSEGCFGAMAYAYQVSKYEVTNAQYAEFLNAKAAAGDPLDLYHPLMADSEVFRGGITRSRSAGSFIYTAIAGREDMPVNLVSFFDALRFANWLHNGQGSGDTEKGAYTLRGGTPTPTNAATVTRNAGAMIFLTSEDEWYKAAYYNAVSGSYFDYPTGTNTQTLCGPPLFNQANCGVYVGDFTDVGSYTGSASPYGTFDQGGNGPRWCWNPGVHRDHEDRQGLRALSRQWYA